MSSIGKIKNTPALALVPKQIKCSNTATYVLIGVLVLLIIVVVVLYALGYIHFGKTKPTPSPDPGPGPGPQLKDRCSEYPLNVCAGSRTTTGKVCQISGGACTETTPVPPPPPPPTPVNPETIAAWFAANPNKEIVFKPKDTFMGYKMSYAGVASNVPTFYVTLFRYNLTSGEEEVVSRYKLSGTSIGNLTSTVELLKSPTVDASRITFADISMGAAFLVNCGIKRSDTLNGVNVYRGLGVQRKVNGKLVDELKPLVSTLSTDVIIS